MRVLDLVDDCVDLSLTEGSGDEDTFAADEPLSVFSVNRSAVDELDHATGGFWFDRVDGFLSSDGFHLVSGR